MPQGVPFATGVVASTQTEVPVEHEVVPLWHGLATNGQETPAVHVLHVPPLQTMFGPQVVPFPTFVPWSTQTEVPVEHEVAPLWHGLAGGTQETPAVQEVHAPALQTWFVPQVVPSATFVVASTQTEVPVEHEVVPLWQGLATNGQATPAVHAVHAPALQT